MKKFFLIILLIAPTILIGQNKKLFILQPHLWVSSGFFPLERGLGLYGKTQLNLTETIGFNLGLGYGFANPRNSKYQLSEIHTRGGFISCGLVKKTRDIKHGKSRKLNFLMTLSIIIGQNQDKANYYFKGLDFKDYTSQITYKQKYTFMYPRLSMGFTHKIKERLNLELGSYLISGDSENFKGPQYFQLNGNKAYTRTGLIGFYFGIGYQLWQKSKK